MITSTIVLRTYQMSSAGKCGDTRRARTGICRYHITNNLVENLLCILNRGLTNEESQAGVVDTGAEVTHEGK